MSGNQFDLVAFLLRAKRRTYASLDDDATVAAPLLPGSKQLGYREGFYAYRDIYFGMAFFVGQETVTEDGRAIWSMGYSGGIDSVALDRDTVRDIYTFLRRALSLGDETMPYRGPGSFVVDDLTCRNEVSGTFGCFHGAESIARHGTKLYELRYGGGALR